MQQIATGSANIVVAGGQESMSQSMHAAHMRDGTKMGDVKFIDTMVKDGLWDAFNNYHMGTTAENVARQWQITREEQDKFAVASQNKAEAARKAGKFKDEIAPVTIKGRKGDTVVDTDEYIKDGTTFEGVSKLRPAFDPKEGTVTAANASGINDGAAVVVLMTPRRSQEARHHAARTHRVVGDHRRRSLDHGHGPDCGIEEGSGAGRLDDQRSRSDRGQRSIRRAGHLGQQGPWLGYLARSTSTAALSPSAIRSALRAAASSTRLLHEMKRSGAKKGLATLCIGGGMGVALCVARD